MDGRPNLRLCNVILDVQITPFGPKSLYEAKGISETQKKPKHRGPAPLYAYPETDLPSGISS